MLTIIHGDDQVSSRKFFLSQKTEESIVIDAEEEIVSIDQYFQESSLFAKSKNILIENLFTRKAKKNFNIFTEVLDKNASNFEIYIWHDKEISVRGLTGFPKFDNQNFKIPTNIFRFVDSILPNNPKNVSNFSEILKNSEADFIFVMIIRQFRLMLGLIDNSENNIEEIKRLADWQRGKLSRQAMSFGK